MMPRLILEAANCRMEMLVAEPASASHSRRQRQLTSSHTSKITHCLSIRLDSFVRNFEPPSISNFHDGHQSATFVGHTACPANEHHKFAGELLLQILHVPCAELATTELRSSRCERPASSLVQQGVANGVRCRCHDRKRHHMMHQR